MSEHDEQSRLFAWAEENESWLPALKNLFSIPNGGKRKNGWWEKLEGLKAGVPDLFLAVPMCALDLKTAKHLPEHDMAGLFIEMKFGKNKSSRVQEDWQERLHLNGYQVEVCYSFEEAKDVILKYLKVPD